MHLSCAVADPQRPRRNHCRRHAPSHGGGLHCRHRRRHSRSTDCNQYCRAADIDSIFLFSRTRRGRRRAESGSHIFLPAPHRRYRVISEHVIWAGHKGSAMDPFILSSIIFVLMLGGIIVGALLRSILPQHHLSKDSQDTVRLGVGLIATMSALVVGLLIAAAKSSYDTQSGQIKQITADVILLDSLLAQYGPEALPLREQIRAVIPAFRSE